jgi:hypothetical protein
MGMQAVDALDQWIGFGSDIELPELQEISHRAIGMIGRVVIHSRVRGRAGRG